MVRHNVDTNQPRSIVLLDTRATSYSAESFEDAVRAAASIVASSKKHNFEFRLLTTDGLEMNQLMPAASIMDRFAELGLSFRGSIGALLDHLFSDTGGVSLTIVTGNLPEHEVAALNRFRRRFEVITVVRFGARAGEWDRPIPDAIVIHPANSDDFARAWNQSTK